MYKITVRIISKCNNKTLTGGETPNSKLIIRHLCKSKSKDQASSQVPQGPLNKIKDKKMSSF